MMRWQSNESRFGINAKLMLARQAVAANPTAGMAHYTLALALFRIGEYVAGLDAFKRAMDLLPPTPDQLVAYVKALLAQGRKREALTVLNNHEREASDSPGLLSLQGAILQTLGQPRKAAEFLFAAIELDPGNVDTAQAILLVLKGLKEWSRLLKFFDDQAERNAVTVPVVVAKMAGLRGLGRTAEVARLLDFDSCVSVKMIDSPPSFRDVSEFNSALASDIASPRKVKLSDIPSNKLTGGVQVEDLEIGSSPAMSCLFEIIEHAVEEYIDSRSGDCAKLLRQLSREFASLECWALLLGFNDTQDLHYHSSSSVAGVYYVAAPEALFRSDSKDGCLVFPSDGIKLLVERFVEPIPGRLVLFPGYLPHRTTPIRCDGERISIAFNTIPRARDVSLPERQDR